MRLIVTIAATAAALVLPVIMPTAVTANSTLQSTIGGPGHADAVVYIVQSRGMVLQAARPIGSVLIADPEIANVQPLSETTLFLVGKTTGATELYVLDGEQNVIERRDVFVTRSLSDMQHTQSNDIERLKSQIVDGPKMLSSSAGN